MSKKISLILSGSLIIFALIIVIVFDNKKETPINQVVIPELPISVSSSTPAAPEVAPVDPFRAEVPTDIKVPELNEPLTEVQKQEIAVPEIVVAAAPGVSTKYRSFDISGNNGQFIPTKVIANVGDIVHINFTAVDQDYDIFFPSYQMGQTAKKGQTKVLEFQARQSGDFLYYCKLCGGPEKGAQGKIIIVE